MPSIARIDVFFVVILVFSAQLADFVIAVFNGEMTSDPACHVVKIGSMLQLDTNICFGFILHFNDFAQMTGGLG